MSDPQPDHSGQPPAAGSFVQVPGKLYITGEYAVVEPGGPAVLIAVNRYVTVGAVTPGTQLTAGADAEVERISYAELERTVTSDGGPFRSNRYVHAAAFLMDRLRAERGLERRPADLVVHNQLRNGDGKKYGLGSSGAITLGLIGAYNLHYQLGLSNQELYRLGMLVLVSIAPKSSGGDLAASLTGGWTYYTSPDRRLLPNLIDADTNNSFTVTETLANENLWAGSSVRRLQLPKDPARRWEPLVGWTGAPATTDDLVGRVHRNRDQIDTEYCQLMRRYWDVVEDFTAGFESGDQDQTRTAIASTRDCLLQLQELTGSVIETRQLTRLVEIAAETDVPAKSSGAGGGDCGIALLPATGAGRAELGQRWQQAGIEPLTTLGVSATGLTELTGTEEEGLKHSES